MKTHPLAKEGCRMAERYSFGIGWIVRFFLRRKARTSGVAIPINEQEKKDA